MAYQLVSTPSNQEAVMTAVRDFAVANGYTNRNYTASNPGTTLGVMTLSRGNLFVSFRWEGTETAANKSIAMYQALGFDPAKAATPWTQLDNSGNGTTGTNLQTGRNVINIGVGPYISLHLLAFDNDAVSGNAAPTVYCVLEYAVGLYRHFGFGSIDKLNDWSGGEWVGGHVWSSISTNESDPVANGHSVLIDGKASTVGSGGVNQNVLATVHAEDLPGGPLGSKWGVAMGEVRSVTSNRVLLQGGIRINAWTHFFGAIIPDSLAGFVPLYPCPLWYVRDITGLGRRVYLLGYMSNIRMVQLRNFNPGDEVTIGNITWKVFPVVRQIEASGNIEGSDNMGIAYVKEVF